MDRVLETEGAEQVLSFLAEAGGDFVSGEAMSDKLGLSRAAVWKHVDALRGQGYRIDARSAHGYRLVEIPDRLSPLEIRPLLATRELGQTLHCFQKIDSTNSFAKDLAEEGALHGELVIAEEQAAGRGRRQRAWLSVPGRDLTFSIVLRPDLAPASAPLLTALASVALCEEARRAGVDASIKWPNDLVVNDRKLAGILTEMRAESERVRWVVMGIGLNVNAVPADFPEGIREQVTSIRTEQGHPHSRALFLTGFLAGLEQWLDRHATEGFEPVRNAWRQLSRTLGREVRVSGGEEELVGVAEDIDECGALLVRNGAAITRVLAGDVEHVRAR
jgi:BirA family biotin operon repressor/biotin-[acetyl-CoA-carboxylase] ligase